MYYCLDESDIRPGHRRGFFVTAMLSFLRPSQVGIFVSMDQITVRDMLAEMETGNPFSMTFVTYDRKRKKGGRIEDIGEAVLLKRDPKATNDIFANRPATPHERRVKKLAELRRAPKHRKWYTRNIRLLLNGHPTSEIRKIHPPLVTTFNHKTVVA